MGFWPNFGYRGINIIRLASKVNRFVGLQCCNLIIGGCSAIDGTWLNNASTRLGSVTIGQDVIIAQDVMFSILFNQTAKRPCCHIGMANRHSAGGWTMSPEALPCLETLKSCDVTHFNDI